MASMRHLLLFAKLPRSGRVKTRLVPPLTDDQVLRLYRAFLEDQLNFLRRFDGFARVGWWSDDLPRSEAVTELPTDGIELRVQCQGDLGARMLHAFERSFDNGATCSVMIGADSPTLPEDHVRQAFATLEAGTDAVMAPAADGGYVLLGLSRARAELFDGPDWGGPAVARETRRLASAARLRLVEIDPWYDVDEISSLGRLRNELCTPAGSERAPATRRCLLDLELPAVL
jgi:rSAM/selenodomain-associated transferase 1